MASDKVKEEAVFEFWTKFIMLFLSIFLFSLLGYGMDVMGIILTYLLLSDLFVPLIKWISKEIK